MAADHDAAAPMPTRLGRYQLLIPIGTGGMGTVYLGHFEVMEGVKRDAAIKLMHPQLRSEPGLAEQLLQEAKLAASIRHPNVVQVLEAGDSPNGVFLAMDYIEGDNLSGMLRATLKRGVKLPYRIAGRVLHDVLTGLHAVHELTDKSGRSLEVVHRDFSPQNILVGVDGISRLTDFGIAKALDQLNATATGIVKGKVGYMSPEQAHGTPLDRRSDVWAAGVVAWEVIAGKRLYREPTEAATLLSVVSGKPPPPLRSMRTDACPELEAAVNGALVFDRNERFATALALRDALTEAFELHGGLADREEVAAFVQEAVGDRIDKRRVQADDVSRLRHAIADVSSEAVKDAKDVDNSSLGSRAKGAAVDPPVEEDATLVVEDVAPTVVDDAEFTEVSTRAALTAERPTTVRPTSRSSLPLVIGALVALAAGGFVAWRFTSAEPTSAPAASAPEVTATAAPQPAVLKVSADQPVAQIEIDGRNVVIPSPAKRVEVPFGDGSATSFVVVAADGRRVEVPLAEGQRAVAVKFPEAKPEPTSEPTASATPPPRIYVPRPQPKDDGLADSPYGN